MYVRKLATPTNAELTANPERLRIVAKSNIEKAFLEADNKERLTATLNTTTIRVLAAILGELTGKSYDPEDACKEYWVARVAEYFIHIRKVRLHEKFRTHSISEIQNNPAFAMLQDLVGGKGYTQAYVILCASAAKDLKAMCKAFNLKNISRLNQKKIYAQLLVDFADEYWLLYSDFDERKDNSHHATAEITTTSNHDSAPASQPANFANAQSDSNSQHEALYYDDSFSDTPGDNSCPEQDIPEYRQAELIPDDNPCFTIIPADQAVILREAEHSPALDIPPEDIIREPYFPPEKFVNVWPADLGSFSFSYKISKKDCTLNYTVRLVDSEFAEGSNRRKRTGDKLLMFYDNRRDSLCPFACYSPMLGIFNFSQANDLFREKFNNQENFINQFMPSLNVILRNAGLLDSNGEIISDGLEAFRVLFDKATTLEHSCRDDNFSMPENPFTTDNDKDNPLSWRESPYRIKALRIMHNIIYNTVDAQYVWHWNKSAVKKINKRIQALTAELHSLFDAQNNSLPADNPGFTIEPSREIARPHYASYPDVISDDCPSITVHACDIQTHTSAIVPYSQAANIRSIFHIIAIYIRLWLAMHITHPDLHFEDFPDGLFTHYTIRKSPRKKLRRAHFEVGSSYTASCYNRREKKLQSFTFLVTGRVVYSDSKDNRKGVMLYVTCNHPDKQDFEGKGRIQYVDSDHGVEVYHYRKCHDTVYGDIVFSFRADRRDNTPYPFKDTTPSEPDYKPLGYATQFISRDFLNYSDNHDTVQTVHAGTHEINPIQPDAKTKSHKSKSAPTYEHDSKLIETKDLHFAEKRAALDANASIITTCLFPVTVMDSLSNLSSKAIIQLGMHMGLFIAKPKGSKRIIIEEFSRRFFAVRNRRTTITTHVRPQPVKEAAQPEGIKIFGSVK